MKRGEDFMAEETFEHFISKLKAYAPYINNQEIFLPSEKITDVSSSGTESPLRVIMCGMGESLMHRRCAEWVKRIRTEVGVRVSIVTNGLLLKEKNIQALVDADITTLLISVPGIDAASYSQYMRIEWERVIPNIEAAHKALPGRIDINATIPDNATFTAADVRAFWNDKGITNVNIHECHSRGGHLVDINLTGRSKVPGSRFCGIIARHNFIAWDGRVLSCCHDLHAANILGDIHHDDFYAIAMRKNPMIARGPDFAICGSCNDAERARPSMIITRPLSKIGRQRRDEALRLETVLAR